MCITRHDNIKVLLSSIEKNPAKCDISLDEMVAEIFCKQTQITRNLVVARTPGM